QVSVSYLEPTPVARVIARGQVLRMGQTTAHLEGRLRLPDGTLLATATASAVLRPFRNMSMEGAADRSWAPIAACCMSVGPTPARLISVSATGISRRNARKSDCKCWSALNHLDRGRQVQ